MKRLNLFIIKSFTGPFLISFFIAMFFLVMQFLWKYIDDLMGKGLEIGVLLKLMFYVSATLIPLALPLAVLFSSIMTLGNLSEKNELTALKASGLSLFRILRPMLVFVFILSLSAFYFTNYILPIANLKWRTIIYNIQQKKPTFSITEGVFYDDIDGFSIKVERKNDNTGELEDVLIYETGTKNQGKTIKAERGEMLKSEQDRFLFLKLINGAMYESLPPNRKQNNGLPYQKTFFSEAIMKFDLSDFDMQEESEDLFKRDHEMMNFIQLKVALDSLVYIQDTLLNDFEKNVQRQILVINPDFKNKPEKDSIPGMVNEESMLKVDTLIFLDSLKQMEFNVALNAAQSRIRASKDLIYTQSILHRGRENTLRDYEASWQKKFTLSFAILVLFFIGAPLGAIIRKGGLGAPLVFAVLFFLLYYIVMISGENMVESGVIEVWIGMWLSSFVLTPLGAFLTYKAANDSALFDRDAYSKLFKRFFRKYSK